MDPGESFPAGIPYPSLSPPGNPSEKKLGVGKKPFLSIKYAIWENKGLC